MLRALIPALSILALTAAQNPGNGISKQTYSVTDPQAAFTWFSKYLPIHCGDSVQMCNNSDASCGQKGRSNLCAESDNTTCTGSSFSSFMFHMVNTSSRPSGSRAVSFVERAFDEKMNAAFAANRYDSFMDFSVAFWALDLDSYIQALQADGVKFLLISWADNTKKPYYSLILHGPHTQVVVELISSVRPTADSAMLQQDEIRYTSGIFYEMGAIDGTISMSSNRLRPLAVSKATADMDEVIRFYETAMFASREWNYTASDGTRYTYWNPGFSSMADKMQVRFVERAAEATTPTMSVKELEQIKFSGHAMVANPSNNSANAICGFDKWYDNHYAIDGGVTSLTQYKAAFDSYVQLDGTTGWPYYQAWGGAPGPENIYAVDPTGDSIQLDGRWTNGAPAGVAGDALGTMCSQGNCLTGQRPTPAACSTALKLTCPGLSKANSKCSDCVYEQSKNWPSLKAAQCLNSDVVAYCVGE